MFSHRVCVCDAAISSLKPHPTRSLTSAHHVQAARTEKISPADDENRGNLSVCPVAAAAIITGETGETQETIFLQCFNIAKPENIQKVKKLSLELKLEEQMHAGMGMTARPTVSSRSWSDVRVSRSSSAGAEIVQTNLRSGGARTSAAEHNLVSLGNIQVHRSGAERGVQ